MRKWASLLVVTLMMVSFALGSEARKKKIEPYAIECCLNFNGMCVCGPIPNPLCTRMGDYCNGGTVKHDPDPISNVERKLLIQDFRSHNTEQPTIEGLLVK